MFDRIVVAIDSEQSRADHVVTAAIELARMFHSEVLVVHVRELERSPSMMGVARPGAMVPQLSVESDAEATQLVDGAVARLRDAGVRAEGRVHQGSEKGSTARELVEIASSYKASLVVVGDRGAPVSDVLLGGVAHRILQMAHCPVLLIR